MILIIEVLHRVDHAHIDYITIDFDMYYPLDDAFDNDDVNSKDKVKQRFIDAIKPLYNEAEIEIKTNWDTNGKA